MIYVGRYVPSDDPYRPQAVLMDHGATLDADGEFHSTHDDVAYAKYVARYGDVTMYSVD
jgi:hypothetical protein